MKKMFLFSMMCLMALSMNAQRCAVLEFRAGTGVTTSQVEGLSDIFLTYFRPAGYTMVERTQIDRVIDEQSFQRSNMTESQMVRVGKILNVSKIVTGTVNIVMGQYNVDVRVINVESGTIAARDGSTFSTSSYRTSMQSLAQKLADQISIKSGGNSSSERSEPYIVNGYLKVSPKDLGSFDSKPKTIINKLNNSKQYGYGTWRLPTNEELAMMRNNNIIGSGNYMTQETQYKKGIVRLVTDMDKGDVIPAHLIEFVDLGLPSGTLWKDMDEGGFYSYNNAIAMQTSVNRVPTKAQWEELCTRCQWIWLGDAYKVVGPNGNFIVFPAHGYFSTSSGELVHVGRDGEYWSSTEWSEQQSYYCAFSNSSKGYLNNWYKDNKRSVRFVRNK